MRLVCTLTAVIVMLGAGCRSQEKQGPSGPATSTIAATEPPASLEGAASPAVSPAAPSVSPGKEGVTVIVGPESVAGWWDGRNWVRAEGSASQIPVQGGETYQMIRLADPTKTARGSAAVQTCEAAIPGSSRIEVPGLIRDIGSGEPPPIAVSGVEDPRPRIVEFLDSAAMLYREAAARLLKERGIEDPDADVVQAIGSDLDGDG